MFSSGWKKWTDNARDRRLCRVAGHVSTAAAAEAVEKDAAPRGNRKRLDVRNIIVGLVLRSKARLIFAHERGSDD
jgi:hypothetical protein